MMINLDSSINKGLNNIVDILNSLLSKGTIILRYDMRIISDVIPFLRGFLILSKVKIGET